MLLLSTEEPIMSHMQQDIYNKFINGDSLHDHEIDAAVEFHKNLSNSLGKIGPTFELAWKESNRMYMAMKAFQEARKEHALQEDRRSKDYQDGYKTGFSWKHDYKPSGPVVFYDNDNNQQKALQTQTAHRRWMLGWQDGFTDRENNLIV